MTKNKPTFNLLFTKPLTPEETEIANNHRSRSAKLRAAIRTDADPMLYPHTSEYIKFFEDPFKLI